MMLLSPIQKFGIFGLIAVLVLAGAMRFSYDKGVDHVQAKWDIATAAQNVVSVTASEKARATEQRQSASFASIEAGYLQATTNEPTPFDIPAALAAGSLKLRNDCPAPDTSSVSETTARSRDRDAAATQALADRVEDSIAAVRAGEAADARERQLSAQVTALQDILRAEREETK